MRKPPIAMARRRSPKPLALGNAAMIEALLNAGADPKTLTTADGETVLMTAARTGNVEAVKVLLSHGADVNARENLSRPDGADVGRGGASCRTS